VRSEEGDVTSDGAPVARVRAGAVRGRHESGVAVFRGIPFAEPRERFGAPEAVRAWDGTRDAVSFGPPPPQSALVGSTGPSGEHGWLTVNVWTPDLAADLPVMVWVQGGGYLFGTSGLPEYDGGRLAREGGVVVVTFNYRLGPEGFALVEGAPANRGLLDQVAALQWVQDNVRSFGGDPACVTVFGQSAGAGCVAALLAMPVAEGLFRRAVVQSMPGVYLAPALAADVARQLAVGCGVGPSDLAAVAPGELSAAADTLMATIGRHTGQWGLAAHRAVPLAPVVDGETLPTEPWAALSQGAARDVDLLVGHVRDEQRLFSLMEGTLGRITQEQADAALDLFAPGPHGADHYRAAGGSAEELYDRVHSDWLFRMPSLHLGEAHGGRTHVYELTWPAPGLGGALGACHGLDVPLVFGNLTLGQPALLLGDDLAEAEVVSARMRAAWTAFAATGDPGWELYDPSERPTRVFDVESATIPYPEESSREIWREHDFTALGLTTAPA
jgi:para-nitrobenzyl esterase